MASFEPPPVSSPRSPPKPLPAHRIAITNPLFNSNRFAQTGGPGPEKAGLLEFSFCNLGGLWYRFTCKFRRWKPFGSAEGQFLVSKSRLGH